MRQRLGAPRWCVVFVFVAVASATLGRDGRVRRAQAAEEGDSPRSAAAAEIAPAGESTEAAHHSAEGAGEAAPELHLKSLAFQLVNFGVLLFILIKFGGPPLQKALQARHQQLKTDLAAAAEARATAEARLKQQEQRLAALENEIASIRATIRDEAQAEKARLIAMAEERARRIREETAFMVDQQVKEAEVELRRQAAQAAIDLAAQLVRRSMDPRDQQRLLDSFVADVGSSNGHGPGPALAPPPIVDGSPSPVRGRPRSEV